MSRGHIQRRGKRSWRIKVDAGRDPLTGQRDTRYVTVHGTKRNAERKLSEILHQLDQGQYVEPSKLMVPEYLERWLKDYASTAVSPTSFERYADLLRLHVAPYLRAVPLSKLQPLHIQGMYAQLLTEGRRRGAGGLNPRTVRHVHTTFKRALQQAVRWRTTRPKPLTRPRSKKLKSRCLKMMRSRPSWTRLRAHTSTPRSRSCSTLACAEARF